MATIFTKIINREIPGEIVWEDEHHCAFLSIDPINSGHTLVVTKREVDHWLDLTEVEILRLNQAVLTVGRILKEAFGCQRIGQMISGFEVPHAHVHLIPMNSVEDFPFPPVHSSTPEGLKKIADQIRSHIPQEEEA